jgi:hypothetical protein
VGAVSGEVKAAGEVSPYGLYRAAWALLNPTQKARVMLKAKWEGRSRVAIHVDWPSLFDPERKQDEDELKACRELIAERPDLFPGATS